MHGSVSRLVRAGAPLLVAAAMFGCSPSPIGDPCVPESIPVGGYSNLEVYIETSSVQCRTRACMVYRLKGNPSEPFCDEPGANVDTCAVRDEVEDQIFCSCRCSVPAGGESNTPLCNCGQGFTCVDDLVTTGGDGVVGGYCVPCIYDGDDRNLGANFDECPTAS
jgi:hypothetical protein